MLYCINSLPNDILLDSSKFKAFADEKLDTAVMMISPFNGVENTFKRRKCRLPQCFPNPSLGSLKVRTMLEKIHSLPDNKILYLSKLEAYADNKFNFTHIIKFVFGREVNIVEKGENAGYQHFLLFPQCFHKAFYKVSEAIIV